MMGEMRERKRRSAVVTLAHLPYFNPPPPTHVCSRGASQPGVCKGAGSGKVGEDAGVKPGLANAAKGGEGGRGQGLA